MNGTLTPHRPSRYALLGFALAANLAFGAGSALAESAFIAPDADYRGTISASGTTRGAPILAGTEAKLTGRNFKPGQKVTLLRGDTVLNAEPYVAKEDGGFEGVVSLPKDAASGLHPIIVKAENPSAAAVFELKVSPDIALSGEDKFTTESQKLTPGLYQAAYSAKNNVLFVTASSGRPPVKDSAILKVDPKTLKTVARAVPAAAPARGDREGGVFAVYGVGVDDVNDTVWVTNTRQNTAAVYKQSDLSLLMQFEPGAVPHGRDVVIDGARGKAYASALGTPNVVVFDAKALEPAGSIEIKSGRRGKDFSVASLHLDADAGKLYTVSLSTNEAAIIDLATGTVDKVFSLEGAKASIGVAFDPAAKRLFVAAQDSDNLLIVDAESGKTLHNVSVGAGALNVTFDPVTKLAFVNNRGAGTVTAVNAEGKIVANLDGGTFPNHAVVDGKGNVYSVNKSLGADDPKGDRITRIAPAK